MDAAASVLFGKTRQAVLSILFDQPDRARYLRDLERQTGISSGALQHELMRLQQADLLIREQDGNRITYRANTEHPVYADLRAIVQKTCGLPVQIKAVLDPMASQIRFAAIYGSIAKGTSHARSDVDLLLVGDLTLADVLQALQPVEHRLGREISVRLFRPDDFRSRLQAAEPFLSGVLNGPYTALIGTPNDA